MSKSEAVRVALLSAGYSLRNYDSTYGYWAKGDLQGEHTVYVTTLSTWTVRPVDATGKVGKPVKPNEIK